MGTKWDPLVRPPEGVCPEKYCFHWVTPGGYADMTGRRYASREEALRNAKWTPFPDGGCSCTFGLCKRLDSVNGSQDFYEPCEPRLEEDSLPWFYFCTLDCISDRFHEKFIRESEQLWGPPMRFAEQMAKLSDEQRLHFYEVLAHNLTVAIRGIWSDESIGDAEKVERMKWINEIQHRVTAKVYVLRLKTHEWTEEDFESLILGYIASHPGIAKEVRWAVRSSYRTVSGVEI